MNSKKILGLILIAAGAGMTFFSNYIAEQVAEGQARIDKAQSQVDKADSIFSINPTTQQVGKVFTGSAQKKIDAGSQQVSQYQALANKLEIGGIIVMVAGAGLFLLGSRKSRGS